MRRSLLGISIVVFASLSVFIVSCKSNGDNQGTMNSANDGFKIAYINRDSVASAYEYYNDIQTSFMLEQQDKEAELSSRYKSLQTRYIKIQRDLQNRMITPTSAQQKQDQLALDQQKLQKDQERYQLDVMEKSQKYLIEFLDSINNYVKLYNKDKGYNMILNNDTLSSIVIYADESMNITEDVIKGLNRRYKAAMEKSNDSDSK